MIKNSLHIILVLVVVLVFASAEQLVENVVVALTGGVKGEADLFQQIRLHFGAHQVACSREAKLNEFTKTRRVIVAERPRVTKSFQHGIGL